MGRWLSIDYGTKRLGIAVTDPLQMFIYPLTTIENRSDDYVISELLKLFDEKMIDKIIVGLPLSLEGKDTQKTKEVRNFFHKLEKRTEIPLIWWDERYSTYEANDFLKQKGLNWKDSRKIIDQIAAAVILTNYMKEVSKNENN